MFMLVATMTTWELLAASNSTIVIDCANPSPDIYIFWSLS